jgi:hypothetical protein
VHFRTAAPNRGQYHWRECFGGAVVTVSLVYPRSGVRFAKNSSLYRATAEEIPGSKNFEAKHRGHL